MTGSGRVVVLIADAIDGTLLRRGIDEGWLPTFAGLAPHAGPIPLAHPDTYLSGSTSQTTITGRRAADHLFTSDRQLAPGTYRVGRVLPEVGRRPPLWSHASAAGLRSTVVGVYGDRSVPRMLGTQVLGWGVVDPTYHFGPR